MSIRIVFMGSPDFAVPTLQGLAQGYAVVGVVTQPDRPAGRGRSVTSPPVKHLADRLGIETIQPERLKEPFAQERLHAWQPDLIVVAAFGQILRKSVLDLPLYGCINVHASLLPRWRGAAPIQAAILHGDSVSGATIMRMDAGIDTGPILTQREVPIEPADTTATLSERLAQAGADLLLETLPDYLHGKRSPTTQDETFATYASMLSKEQGLLDLTKPAAHLANLVRAFNPWPGAYLLFQGQALKIHAAHAVDCPTTDSGMQQRIGNLPALATAQGCLILDTVQPAGKRAMSGSDFLRGARGWAE